jgi:hypothetical protein
MSKEDGAMATTTGSQCAGRRVLILLALVAAAGILWASRRGADGTRIGPHAGSETAPASLAPQSPETPPELSAIPGGTTDWWSAVTASIERDEYKFTMAEEGGKTALQAPNRAHNFRSRYRESEVEVLPRQSEGAPAWRLSWQTKAWGRSGAMTDVNPVSPEVNADGTRVTYRHGCMNEWYENRAEGLEQGFTIEARPAGSGPLRIAGEFAGAVRPLLRDDGEIDLLDENEVTIFRYGKLAVWDATGMEIESSLAVSGRNVAIVVDDRQAQYPLTIDPLMRIPGEAMESNINGAHFGWSVSRAGDVNADGFDDVIVGAPDCTKGQVEEGCAYVYLGSPTGLETIPIWSIESDQARAHLGYSVSTAGDVNRDGYSDVIIGAYRYDNVENNEGRVFIFHGSPSGLESVPTPILESNLADAGFGNSVATAGDVNGDGFSDVIIGARWYSNGESYEGRAFVFLGSPAGIRTPAAWVTESNQIEANYGFWVSTAGDVNDDTFSDVVISARWYDNGQMDEGRAYVFHGSATGLALAPAWTAESNQEGALFGASVSTAGDVNGDEFDDVIVGATWFDNDEIDEGRAYLFYGSATGLLPTASWTAEGNTDVVWFGGSVSTAGDVNHDGYSDVVVGSEHFASKAFLYLGSPAGLAFDPAWVERSWNPLPTNFGFSVAWAGDVNGDGFADLIVGSHTESHGQSGEGLAYVFHGSPQGLTHSWQVQSNQVAARLGYSVSTAGDVNNDTYSDVIVGAIYYDNGQSDEGKVFVYHGSAAGLSLSPAWSAESNQANAGMGNAVANAGDVNGDNYEDVIVGAWQYDNGQTDEGRAYIFHGSPTGLLKSPAKTLESNQVSARFGSSVATAGKVNGDVYADVLVGAVWFDNGQGDEGRAFAYYGSTTGIGPAPDWTAESNQANAWFGHSVSTAGSVNDDNFDDVIIGAPLSSNGQSQEGRAFVYYGSGSGLLPAAAWTGESNVSQAQYGQDVSTAGDVNGDGFSDVIVGTHRFDGPEIDEGRAWVYHGSMTGLAMTPSWTGDPNQAGAYFGWSVSTAGDVNGDGFSDVLVGAPEYDNPPPWYANSGAVFAYVGSATGLGASPEWIGRGFQNSDYGYDVSTAGDVNGDIFSDIIIGVPLYSSTENNEGFATLYYGYGPGGLSRGIPAPLEHSDSPQVYAIANDEGGTQKSAEMAASAMAPTALLDAGSPNPFGASTELGYNVPESGPVRLTMYSVTGQVVASLVEEVQSAGRYHVRWDGRDRGGKLLPAGVYFVRLELEGRTESRKLVIAR